MKVGFSEHVFRRRYPDQTPRMLAVAGAYPMAAVADLADDQQFRGTLILDVTSETLRAARWNDQREHVEAAHNWSPQHAMDSLIRAALQQRFTVCQAHLSLARCSRSWWERGKLPTPAPVVSSFSRFSTGQFVASPARQSSDAASHRTGRPVELEPHPHASVQLLRDAQRKLRARGGRLVLVHFPTRVVDRPSAERAQRKRHWLSLQRTTGIDSIHFSDLPGMSQLRVADGQHLNADDAKQFTDALLDAIEAMDLIPSSVADDRARSSR